MYVLDICDIIFFIKSLKAPHLMSLIILNSLQETHDQDLASYKLQHISDTKVSSSNFYFNRLPRIWNVLPIIDYNLSLPTIKYKLTKFLWNHFELNFDPDNACTFSFVCPCCNCNKSPKPPNFDHLL